MSMRTYHQRVALGRSKLLHRTNNLFESRGSIRMRQLNILNLLLHGLAQVLIVAQLIEGGIGSRICKGSQDTSIALDIGTQGYEHVRHIVEIVRTQRCTHKVYHHGLRSKGLALIYLDRDFAIGSICKRNLNIAEIEFVRTVIIGKGANNIGIILIGRYRKLIPIALCHKVILRVDDKDILAATMARQKDYAAVE